MVCWHTGLFIRPRDTPAPEAHEKRHPVYAIRDITVILLKTYSAVFNGTSPNYKNSWTI